ncbi:hypothetical protein AB0B56_14710 [Streptosporangium canum]|uniref:hypothetical protein n=1 Tax=Streptosporangium canum TaxID=324952 RepID=UPI0034330544
MTRWGAGLRRAVAASALGLAGGAFVVLLPSSGSAEIETGYHNYTYDCVPSNADKPDGSLAPTGANGTKKKISVEVSIPKTLYIGQALKIGWKFPDSELTAPHDYAEGAKIAGSVQMGITGKNGLTWEASGTKSLGALKERSTVIDLPELTTDSWSMTDEGEIKVTPGSLDITFTPPKSKFLINDTASTSDDPAGPGVYVRPPITYDTNWSHSTDRKLGDERDDVHETTKQNASVSVSFVGTGIEYLAERHKETGIIGVKIDDLTIAENERPDASKRVNGTPMADNERLVKEVLWSTDKLPQDKKLKYGKHTLTLENLAPEGKFMLVDAFNLITDELQAAPDYFNTKCTPQGRVTPVPVKVEKAPTSPSPSLSPSPSPSPTTAAPKPTTTVTTTPASTPKPTLTVTATVTPTRATPTTPQVTVVPSGGAQTGEASDDGPSGMGLIGGGTAMVLGSVLGGVALKRRRAAHVRGRG